MAHTPVVVLAADPIINLKRFAIQRHRSAKARHGNAHQGLKALVGVPMARFSGTMTLNGKTLEIDDWVGSQNHNWGVRHTDRYAWGQVCGFDNARDSFLEVASAQLKLGPLWSPLITLVVARHAGKEYAFNSFLQGVRARASYDYF